MARPAASSTSSQDRGGRYSDRANASTAHSANTISTSDRDHSALPTTNGKIVPGVITNAVANSRAMPAKMARRNAFSGT